MYRLEVSDIPKYFTGRVSKAKSRVLAAYDLTLSLARYILDLVLLALRPELKEKISTPLVRVLMDCISPLQIASSHLQK